MVGEELSNFLGDAGSKPVFRELSEAGYSYVETDTRGYWVMEHSRGKPVIYYDSKNDTTLPVLIVEQREMYM